MSIAQNYDTHRYGVKYSCTIYNVTCNSVLLVSVLILIQVSYGGVNLNFLVNIKFRLFSATR
jgi:hypothetical protein